MKKLLLLTTILFLSVKAWSTSQVWFANADNAEGWYVFGTEKKEKYSAAVFIPRDLLGTENLKIGGVSINMGTPNFKNLKVWVSTSLPDVGMPGDVITMDVSSSKITPDTYSNVKLPQFYEVPADGLYVGYTFEVTSLGDYGNLPISYSLATQQREGSFFVNTTSMGEWLTDSEVKLMMKVLLECDAKDNSVTADDFGTNYTVVGTQANVPVKLTNYGSNAVRNISYTVTTDGKVSEERTIDVNLLSILASDGYYFTFDADEITVPHSKTLTITKVNGEPNNAANNTAQGTLITVTRKPTYKPVIEEFTATWCGYCPFGIEGMKAAHEKYGDKAVLIAVHGNDVMSTNDYSQILASVSGYPSAFFNRETSFYPNASNMTYLLDNYIDRITVADIDTKAYWNSDEQTGIDVATKTTFVYHADEANYAIAYVLLADGLTGTGSSWSQSNYLSGQVGNEPEMQSWYTAPSKVSGMEYDHVAIAAWGIRDGLEGSVPAQITANKEQTFTHSLSIADNTLVQDKSKLKVVTLLIDKETGVIMNASQTTIGSPEANGINKVTSSTNAQSRETKYYNLQGQQVGDDYRGIVVTRGKKMLRR